MSINKPPAGIVPKTMHDHTRATDLTRAILRYLEAGGWPPEEWAKELTKLNEEYAPAKFAIRAGHINHV